MSLVPIYTASNAQVYGSVVNTSTAPSTFSGNVGIGTTTPQTNLDVIGSIKGVITFKKAVTASGTNVDFGTIPSWARRITVVLSGVTESGSSHCIVQVGTGGSPANSGYTSYFGVYRATNVANAVSSTAGFGMWNGTKYAQMTLINISGNIWVSSHSGGMLLSSLIHGISGGGTVTLGGVLDIVRVTRETGTDTFTGGTINILYEG